MTRFRRPGLPAHATILITGASSGIGRALAVGYARPGRTLLLWGRDENRLAAVAAACRRSGAVVRLRALDLATPSDAVDAVRDDDRDHPVALAILSAGLGDMKQADRATEDPARVIAVGTVNFVAATALATALAERMAARGTGTIVLLGSAAGFHPLPMAATYAASKAGLARFAEALSIGIERHGVAVLLVTPGFIDTPMSRGVDSPQPFLLSADRAARRIMRAVARRERHLVLPWPFAILGAVDRLTPPRLRRAILRRLQAARID